MSEISFMGHQTTANKLQTDPEKVRAIIDIDARKNRDKLRSFLGLINYISRFLPKITTVIEPLHNQTR